MRRLYLSFNLKDETQVQKFHNSILKLLNKKVQDYVQNLLKRGLGRNLHHYTLCQLFVLPKRQ